MKALLIPMLAAIALATPGARAQVTTDPGTTQPVVVSRVQPDYTQEAWDHKIQGSVFLDAIVLANGTVDDVTVTRSLDKQFGLDEKAIEALKRWTFKPGLKEGKPVAVKITVDLRFTLAKGPRP